MRPDTIVLAIFEKYTPEERLETADKLTHAMSERDRLENEKKAADAGYNEQIKKHSAEIENLFKLYSKGGETAQIGCDIRYDNPEVGKKSYYRMDSSELVETHDMSWEEKQETIQFPLTESAPAPEPTPEQVAAACNDVLRITPVPDEEVTRLCGKTADCVLFAEHDGECMVEPTGMGDEKPGAII